MPAGVDSAGVVDFSQVRPSQCSISTAGPPLAPWPAAQTSSPATEASANSRAFPLGDLTEAHEQELAAAAVAFGVAALPG